MSKVNPAPGVLLALLALVVFQASSGATPTYSPWSAPVSLGDTVNSPYDDALAALSKDELSLYFTSNRPVAEGGVGGYDLWVSQRLSADGAWAAPVCLGSPINTNAQEAGPALSRDGHWLFFHRTTERGDYDLMASWRAHTNDDFGWEEPFNLGPNVNTEFPDAGAAFFEGEDGSPAELYFGSARGGGFDLFVSRLQPDGTFGPAELVAELSSAGNDQRPSVSRDGREIYFHSTRTGSAGADIWRSTRASVFDPWTAPVNVTEMNTVSSDAQPTLSPTGEMLIFNSNRAGDDRADRSLRLDSGKGEAGTLTAVPPDLTRDAHRSRARKAPAACWRSISGQRADARGRRHPFLQFRPREVGSHTRRTTPAPVRRAVPGNSRADCAPTDRPRTPRRQLSAPQESALSRR